MTADAAHVATLAPAECAVVRATGPLALSITVGQPLACLYRRNQRRAHCFPHGTSSWEVAHALHAHLGTPDVVQ